MPIAVVYRAPAMTLEQYMASWSGGPPVSVPAGLIFHAGLGEGDAFSTITVWNSREAYDLFAPVFASLMTAKGLEFGPPQILPVHHFMRGGRTTDSGG
jgi:hypothetical protein